MKNYKLTLLMIFAVAGKILAQTQMKCWYFPSHQIDMTIPLPSIVAIPGAPSHLSTSSNGIYDTQKKLQFNVAGLSILNKSQTTLANINGDFMYTPEIAIVPFPDNDGCSQNKYYIFNSVPGGTTHVLLNYSVVDMNASSCLGSPILTSTTIADISEGRMGGIAVGKQVNGVRFIYFSGGAFNSFSSAGARIYKASISSSGISVPQLIFHDQSGNLDFETSEMDLSPDGRQLAIASNANFYGMPPNNSRYYIVGLNSSGDWDNLPAKHFNVGVVPDNTGGGRGVEFYRDNTGNTKLLVSAGTNGLYMINPLSPAVGQYQIPNSGNYGSSQIELGSNGYMYAGSSTKVAAIDIVSQSIPFFNTASDISLPPTFIDNSLDPKFYTLPDQIDGEDYEPFIRSACTELDLFIRDNDTPGHFDFGEEPNPDNGAMWESNDIYVHSDQSNPNDPTSINPIANTLNYIYVVIHNNSCVDYNFFPGDLIHLYYAKASTALDWYTFWDGSMHASCNDHNGNPTNPVIGEEIGSGYDLPDVPAGSSRVVEIPWPVPNADDFYTCLDWQHFCLLARMNAVSISDEIGFEGSFLYTNVQAYNNIAWKNLTIVQNFTFGVNNENCSSDKEIGGTIGVGNPTNESGVFKLHFKTDRSNTGKPLYEQAEIKITLDEETWKKWSDGGFQSENIVVKREDCRQLVVTGNPAQLLNLSYEPKEISRISLSFNFLTEKVDQTQSFKYRVVETRNEDDNALIGGELYQIGKPVRYLFDADGGTDKQINFSESVELSANSIGESAFYNWYDESGTLIFSGKDFNASPEITTKYKLEVVAQSDGFTSYDSIVVHVKDYSINSISPNPSTNLITIDYQAKKAQSGYFTIVQLYSSSSYNYIIDTQLTSKVIDISTLTPGNYLVRLICDGIVRDESSLIIQ